MTRGYPDYNVSESLGEVWLPSNIPELAARLGSIVTWDRRGEVVLLDDFEETVLKWNVTAIGGSGALDTTTARNGVRSVKCTTGAGAGNNVILAKGVSILSSQKLGFEWSFSPQNTDMHLYLRVWHYDGTNRKKAGVEIYPDSGICKYYDSAGAAQTFLTFGELNRALHMFHTFKVVIDFANDAYTRFMINNTEVDLSAYAILTEANAEAPRTDVSLYVYTDAAGARVAYLDDFILTKNE